MLKRLASLMKSGKKIVIMTDDIESNVDERLKGLKELVPGEFAPNLSIFSDSANKGYSFDQGWHKVTRVFEDYTIDGYMLKKHKQWMDNQLQGAKLSGKLVYRTGSSISPNYRMDLTVEGGHDRTKILRYLQNASKQAGMGLKFYKTGGKSIRVVRQHKEDAVRFVLNQFHIDPSRALIMADSARQDAIDYEFLAQFPEAINFNVGKYSETLAKRNPKVVQFSKGERNVPQAQRILNILAQRQSVPESLMRGQSARRKKEFAGSAAMTSKGKKLVQGEKYGGIDFNFDKMNKIFTVKNEDTGEIKFYLDPAMLQQLKDAPGFVPVIINIQPLKSLPAFLGIRQEDKQEQEKPV